MTQNGSPASPAAPAGNPVVVTRFAPSPTGFLHVGGARTALYNLLFARKHGGRFLLRIEDTDQGRHVPEAEQAIFDGLSWLGILWDEGPAGSRPGLPENGGPNGPYRQSERRHLYEAAFVKLLADGKAYRDFTTPAELDALRKDAERRKVPFVFRRGPLPESEEKARLADGAPHVLRLRMPDADIVVHDLVRGDVNYPADTLDDFVIRKSDGWPTYHMGVVVDDAGMQVTHVIRAAEHLANTPRHIALQRALGVPTPTYAHIPVVLNANGSKMSKRNKGAKVEDYRAAGWLPSALVNYMALVGWSPGEDRELLTFAEMASLFDIARINKSNGRWDLKKCRHFNKEYILRRTPPAELKAAILDWVGREVDRWLPSFNTRMQTIEEFVGTAAPLWTGEVVYDAAAFRTHVVEAGPDRLAALGYLLAGTDWKPDKLHDALQAHAADKGGLGKLGQTLRVALCGRLVSPPLHETLAVLGRDESLRRIARALAAVAEAVLGDGKLQHLVEAASVARAAKLPEDGLAWIEAAEPKLPAGSRERLSAGIGRAELLADLGRFDEAGKLATELTKTAEGDAGAMLALAGVLRRVAEDIDEAKKRAKAYEPVITLAGKAADLPPDAPGNRADLRTAAVVLKAFGLHRIGKEEPALKALAPAVSALTESGVATPANADQWVALVERFAPPAVLGNTTKG